MPGVGPRSAERIALWMVQAREQQPEGIARAIARTRAAVHPCAQCGFFATAELCEICADESRASELLCVVEQPTDILPLEKTSAFRGRYHSLGGRISPLDRVAPEDLRIAALLERVEKESPSEIIFALAADVEGEATTNYLVELSEEISGLADPHRARPAGRWRTGISRRADPLPRPIRPDEVVEDPEENGYLTTFSDTFISTRCEPWSSHRVSRKAFRQPVYTVVCSARGAIAYNADGNRTSHLGDDMSVTR